MTTVDQQKSMFFNSQERMFRENEAFMDMVNHPTNPMTKTDLERLIARNPERYSRFSGFLNTLS